MRVSAKDQVIHVIISGFCFNEGGEIMGRPVIWNPDREMDVPFPKGMRLCDLPANNILCWGRVKANWDEIGMIEEGEQ